MPVIRFPRVARATVPVGRPTSRKKRLTRQTKNTNVERNNDNDSDSDSNEDGDTSDSGLTCPQLAEGESLITALFHWERSMIMRHFTALAALTHARSRAHSRGGTAHVTASDQVSLFLEQYSPHFQALEARERWSVAKNEEERENDGKKKKAANDNHSNNNNKLESGGEVSVARRVLSHGGVLTMRFCFVCLKQHASDARRAKHVLTRRIFLVWREHGSDIQTGIADLLTLRNQHALRMLFPAWRAAAKAARLCARSSTRTMVGSWQRWRLACHFAAQTRVWGSLIMRRAVRKWRGKVSVGKELQRKRSAAVIVRDHALTRILLRHWHESTVLKQYLVRREVKQTRRLRKTHVLVWKQWVIRRLKARQRRLLHADLTRRFRKGAQRVWFARMQFAQRFSSLCTARKRTAMGTAFREWRRVSSASRVMRAKEQAVRVRWRRRVVSRTWRGWCLLTKVIPMIRTQACSAFTDAMRKKKLFGLFQVWKSRYSSRRTRTDIYLTPASHNDEEEEVQEGGALAGGDDAMNALLTPGGGVSQSSTVDVPVTSPSSSPSCEKQRGRLQDEEKNGRLPMAPEQQTMKKGRPKSAVSVRTTRSKASELSSTRTVSFAAASSGYALQQRSVGDRRSNQGSARGNSSKKDANKKKHTFLRKGEGRKGYNSAKRIAKSSQAAATVASRCTSIPLQRAYGVKVGQEAPPPPRSASVGKVAATAAFQQHISISLPHFAKLSHMLR
jgi:hypothetical protein